MEKGREKEFDDEDMRIQNGDLFEVLNHQYGGRSRNAMLEIGRWKETGNEFKDENLTERPDYVEWLICQKTFDAF